MKRFIKIIADMKGGEILKKSSSYFSKTRANTTKLIRWISSHLNPYSIAKNTIVFISFFFITCFICLLIRTKSPLSDVFTTGRISILKDRPANITRDIIIDMSSPFEFDGTAKLTQSIIQHIAKKRPNWRLLILTSPYNKTIYNLTKNNNVKLIETNNFTCLFMFLGRTLSSKFYSLFYDKFIQLLHYDRIFCDNGCDLVWDPSGSSSFCNFINTPRISTIHDIAYFDTHPPFLKINSFLLISKICMKKAIDFSKKIITVSEFSQDRICDKFRVTRDFVKLIPIQLGTRLYPDNSPEKHAKILGKYKLNPQKYFIFCSGWWPNKNHSNLIKAFNKFTGKNSEIKLILVGQHFGRFESRPIQEFSSDQLIITGFVPDEELGILLKNALAFIHPSVYEGFGMPIIEAMANGIPVACSNAASLPEVAGSAALFFDPFDTNSITRAMQRLADDPQLRKDLIRKGYEQAKKYSDRDAMVDEYIRVMEEVMHENDLKKATAKK